MGELHESLPDPDFVSGRLCTAAHQVQKAELSVGEGCLHSLEEYGRLLEGDFLIDHLGMCYRDDW